MHRYSELTVLTSPRVFARYLTLLLLTVSLNGCALLSRDLEPPQVSLLGIQTGSITGNLSLALLARVRITNPNSVDLPIESGRFTFTLNGQTLAASELNDDFIIKANTNTDVDIEVQVNLLQGVALGLNLLNEQNPKIDWQLEGHIDVGMRYLGRVPVYESGIIELGALNSGNSNI